MVDVYDATSAGNKIAWKRNLQAVEDLFYKFEEKSTW